MQGRRTAHLRKPLLGTVDVGLIDCDQRSSLIYLCLAKCSANSGFQPVASGGNGGSVQYWFVGYDPALKVSVAPLCCSDLLTEYYRRLSSLATKAPTRVNCEPTFFRNDLSNLNRFSAFPLSRISSSSSSP